MKAPWAVLSSFSLEDLIRGILGVLYVTIIVICFTTNIGPRIFWTMALPLLIMMIVLIGFNTWRRICPLAYWGTFGVRFRLKKAKVRRVPEWIERWFFLISLAFLVTMLVIRLVLINGDGIFLGITLIVIGFLAAFTNFSYSGRTWCNFFCPVGTVERIYTDPNSLRIVGNSECAKCTACKRHCPDIDQENAYWKDVTLPSRRIAFYSFPGIVLGFYTYYFLRAGEWEAYFDGRWTRHSADLQLAFGPGFFFAPQIPAVIASVLTLVGSAALSYFLFLAVEHLISLWNGNQEQVRHVMLSVASFSAFNIFYLFAGAPTLRLIPGGARIVAFIVPLVSGILLYKRWSRQSEDYVKVKSAKHLLPLWKSKTPPPQNPAEVFAYFQGKSEAHAAQVNAYEEVVREILADGMITQRELSLLAQMRINLDITESEHRKIFATLSEQDRSLFDPAHATSVERRLQLQGYTSALTQLLIHGASAEEMAVLRQDYGIEPEVHEAVLKELRGEGSPVTARIRKQIDRLANVRIQIASLSRLRMGSLRAAFVMDILLKSQDQYMTLIKEALSPLGDAQFQANLNNLTSADPKEQTAALEYIRKELGPDFSERLRLAFESNVSSSSMDSTNPIDAILEALLASPDVYHRAGAALLLAEQASSTLAPLLRRCLADEHPLVRETVADLAVSVRESVDAGANQSPQSATGEPVQQGLDLIQEVRGDNGFGQLETKKDFTGLCSLEKMMFLHQVPLFADLSPDDLCELSDLAQEITIHAPDALVREGDMADDLYVITAGKSEATVLRNGKEHVIGTAESGTVIGEMAVIDGRSRSATVRALTQDVHLLRIRGEAFRHVLANRPDLSAQVMRIISLRLRQVLDSL
jgi:cyclic nucleotide-binding protein/HEAT repeat protein/4Fe-4S binding protein